MKIKRNYKGNEINLFVIILLILTENLNRIYHIIIKNFKIIIRSKSSALIVIFGPLIVMILIGIAFNNSSMYGVHLGIYSKNYSSLSDQIVKNLETENYIVTKITNETDCIEYVKTGQINLCLIMSPSMKIGGDNNITFYVDYSRVNIVYAVMNDIYSKLSTTTENISINMTQSLINQIELIKRELNDKSKVLTEISTNNNIANDQVSKATTSTENITVKTSFKDLGFTDVKDYFERVYDYMIDNNISMDASGADELNVSIDILESNLKRHLNNATLAQDNIKNTTEQLKTLRITLGKEKAAIETLKVSVDKINKGVSGLQSLDAESIVNPINTNVQTVVTKDTHLGRLFPSFLMLVIMFICILLGATLVLNEKSTNANFRNFITPTRDLIFLIGTYLTSLIIVFIQVGIIFIAVGYFMSYTLLTGIIASLYPLILIATIFIFIGIALGYLFDSYETSMLAALFAISASMVLSNTILPLESIPNALKDLLALNPFVLGENAFRGLMLFGIDIKSVSHILFYLWIYIPLTLIVAYVCMKIYKKRVRK
jgi:hypothetical protein